MADEYRDRFRAKCSWVRGNNGIYRAQYDIALGMEYVLINRRWVHGQPIEEKTYWIEIQPAFPHDAERSG